MGRFLVITGIIALLFASSCGEKTIAPTPKDSDRENLEDTLYIPLSPTWDSDHGYSFSAPQDVHVGRDTYIYVCDTGNNRVLRMDAGGTVLGEYTGIPNPTQVTQDELMRLIVVNDTRDVYKIDLGPTGDGAVHLCYNGSTATDSGFVNASEVFTGVTDLPGYDKTYLLSVSSSLITTGKVVMMMGDTLGGFNDTILDSVIESVTNDTLFNPVVEYGLGAGYAASPNGLYSYTRNDSIYVLMTQDSSTFKTQLLTIRNWYYNVYRFVSSFNPTNQPDIYQLDFFDQPEDACADLAGNIYIVDADDDAEYGAYKFNAKGQLLESFGENGSGPGNLDSPMGIAYDEFSDRNTVYIADTGNNRIVRFKLNTDLE
ncbi:MAG: hypothetical protein GF307_12875 [candidate division Zixibacteria bacterium]|nr:hypothetical protein [candidate division Zixibacteria bacterium]